MQGIGRILKRTMQTQTTNEKLRVVTYRRVSTVEQVENNSLGLQQRECLEYAQRHGYDVVREFKDEGESAKTADRPGLQDLLVFCSAKKNAVDGVVIHKIDRLSRNADDFSAIRALLRKHNVRLISVTEPISEDAVGKLTQGLLAIVAEFDNDIRTWRATNGMREAVLQGRYVLRAPVGYRDTHYGGEKNIEPDDMAPLVLQAFELVGTGQYTQEEARVVVNKTGLTNKRGKPIPAQYFHTMLRNKLYMGVIDQFDVVKEGLFECVVPTELFNRVQVVLKRKGSKHPAHKRDNPDFPLSRFIVQPSGIKYTGSWSRGNGGRYAKYQPRGKGKTHDRDKFHELFASYMDQYAFSAGDTLKLKQFVQEEFVKATKENAKSLDSLRKRQDEISKLQSSLLVSHSKGLVPDAVLKTQLDTLEGEKLELEVSITLQGSAMPKVDDALVLAEQFLLSPGNVWLGSTHATQVKLQRFQFPSGVVFDGQIFGTTEVSFVFNAKEAIISPLSSPVRRVGFEPT